MHRHLGIVSRVGEQGPEVGRGSPHVWGCTFLLTNFAYRAAVAQFSGPDVLGQGGCCDILFKGEVRRCLTLGLEESNPRSRGAINHLARLAHNFVPTGRQVGGPASWQGCPAPPAARGSSGTFSKELGFWLRGSGSMPGPGLLARTNAFDFWTDSLSSFVRLSVGLVRGVA